MSKKNNISAEQAIARCVIKNAERTKKKKTLKDAIEEAKTNTIEMSIAFDINKRRREAEDKELQWKERMTEVLLSTFIDVISNMSVKTSPLIQREKGPPYMVSSKKLEEKDAKEFIKRYDLSMLSRDGEQRIREDFSSLLFAIQAQSAYHVIPKIMVQIPTDKELEERIEYMNIVCQVFYCPTKPLK